MSSLSVSSQAQQHKRKRLSSVRLHLWLSMKRHYGLRRFRDG